MFLMIRILSGGISFFLNQAQGSIAVISLASMLFFFLNVNGD